MQAEVGRCLLPQQLSALFCYVCHRPEKVRKWRAIIEEALRTNVLRSGDASKLAGGLSWATQNLFSRFGRALLRPLYAQQYRRSSQCSRPLRMALKWWLEVLALQLAETRMWKRPSTQPLQLFADARGQPPRLAAVLVGNGRILYTDMEPAAGVLAFFKKRADNQIMGLELLALALGLSTFAAQCTSQRVRVFSDNVGAERSADKGSAKEWDHSAIVHCLWHRAAQLHCHLFIERVPTKARWSAFA